MDRDKIVVLLNQDLEGEHAAIIQYLTHAYAMGGDAPLGLAGRNHSRIGWYSQPGARHDEDER